MFIVNSVLAAALKRRFVQLMSPPFNGEVKYGAGAAQFGLDISDHVGVRNSQFRKKD